MFEPMYVDNVCSLIMTLYMIHAKKVNTQTETHINGKQISHESGHMVLEIVIVCDWLVTTTLFSNFQCVLKVSNSFKGWKHFKSDF